jgi:hypothetical protein
MKGMVSSVKTAKGEGNTYSSLSSVKSIATLPPNPALHVGSRYVDITPLGVRTSYEHSKGPWFRP